MKDNNKKKKYICGLVISIIILWYCLVSKQNYKMIVASVVCLILFIILIVISSDLKIKIINKKANNKKVIQKTMQTCDISIKQISLISKKVISKLLSENNKLYFKSSIEERIDYNNRSALYQMLNDTKHFKKMNDFKMLYNADYFLKIINVYFPEELEKNEESSFYDNDVYLKELYLACENIYNFSLEKIIYGYLNDRAKLSFAKIDIINLLSIYSAITQIVFLENKINSLIPADELYQIISKMLIEVGDMDIVYNKILSIYDIPYKEKLGFISNEMLKIAIIIIKYKINSLSKINDNLLIYNGSNYSFIDNISSVDNIIKFWLESLAKDEVKISDSIIYIIAKIDKIIVDNNDLLLECLQNVDKWNDYFKYRITFEKKAKDKKRYLEGDFSKEKEELAFKYNMLNIENGNDFEIYLTNLFRELNYKVKHCGKSGDQGGDIIISKNDTTYVIQAKYYANKVDNTSVQEVIGAIRFYNANRGVVITNSIFTKNAKELAKSNKIILIDGSKLKKLIQFIYDDDKDTDYIECFINQY